MEIVIPIRTEYYKTVPDAPAPTQTLPVRRAARAPMNVPGAATSATPTAATPSYTPQQAQELIHRALRIADEPPVPPSTQPHMPTPEPGPPGYSEVAARLHATASDAIAALAAHSGRVDPSVSSVALNVALMPDVRRALALPPVVASGIARPVQLHTPGSDAHAGDAWPTSLPEGAVCAWDLHPFTWAPIGEVIRWDEERRRAVLRNYFCSFACNSACILSDGHRPDTPRRLGLMNTMARDVYGIDRHMINTAPPREMIFVLGIERFREMSGERSYSFIPDMFVGLCRLVLEEPTRYRSIRHMEALLATSDTISTGTSDTTPGQAQPRSARGAAAIATTPEQHQQLLKSGSAQHASSYAVRRGMLSFVQRATA